MRLTNKTQLPDKLLADMLETIAGMEQVRLENVPVYAKHDRPRTRAQRFSGLASYVKHDNGLHVDGGKITLSLPEVTYPVCNAFADKHDYANKPTDDNAYPVYLYNCIWLIAHELSHIKDQQDGYIIDPEVMHMRHDNRPHEILADKRARQVLACLVQQADRINAWKTELRIALLYLLVSRRVFCTRKQGHDGMHEAATFILPHAAARWEQQKRAK